MWLSDTELAGRTVIAANGQVVGTVSALLLDTGTWTVGALRMRLRKEIAERLGASHGLFRAVNIELSTQAVKSVGDAVLISTDVDGLRRYLSGEGASPSP